MRNRIKRMSKSTLVVTALSFVLVTALLVGATLAFLVDITEARVNNFTLANPDLSARLVEPNWDGIVDYYYVGGIPRPVFGFMPNGDRIFGFTNGNPATPVTTHTHADAGIPPRNPQGNNPAFPAVPGTPYGVDAANEMIPGRVALKNPIIYNTGEIWDIWVAVRVSIVYSVDDATSGQESGALMTPADLLKVQDIININWNLDATTGWVFLDGLNTPANGGAGGEFLGQQILLYRQRIDSAEAFDALNLPLDGNRTLLYGRSNPVFTDVNVNASVTNEEMEALNDIGGFSIFVEGFAVQGDVAATFGGADGFQAWATAGGVDNTIWGSSWPINVANPIHPRNP